MPQLASKESSKECSSTSTLSITNRTVWSDGILRANKQLSTCSVLTSYLFYFFLYTRPFSFKTDRSRTHFSLQFGHTPFSAPSSLDSIIINVLNAQPRWSFPPQAWGHESPYTSIPAKPKTYTHDWIHTQRTFWTANFVNQPVAQFGQETRTSDQGHSLWSRLFIRVTILGN